MDLAVILVFVAMACAYVTRSLLLTEKFGHEGPFKAKNQFVAFPDSGHIQRVCLFDRLRRLFGVYTVENRGDGNRYWVVNEDKSERWTCPFCLSFWTALAFTALVFALVPELRLWVIPLHFAIACGSTIGYGFLERALN